MDASPLRFLFQANPESRGVFACSDKFPVSCELGFVFLPEAAVIRERYVGMLRLRTGSLRAQHDTGLFWRDVRLTSLRFDES